MRCSCCFLPTAPLKLIRILPPSGMVSNLAVSMEPAEKPQAPNRSGSTRKRSACFLMKRMAWRPSSPNNPLIAEQEEYPG